MNNNLITEEIVFNESFKLNCTLNNLLEYALVKNFIDNETMCDIISYYNNCIKNYILSSFEFDEECDYNMELKEKANEIVSSINEYLISLKNPYKAFKYIKNNNPNFVIEKSLLYHEKLKIKIDEKLKKIESNSLFNYNLDLKMFVKSLKNRSIIKNSNISLYTLMGGKIFSEIESLNELENILERVLLELQILNRFDKKEVVEFLLSFNMEDVGKNITTTALYNYFFNLFYKDESTILFSENMSKIVPRDILTGLFDEKDIIETFKKGNIEFSKEENEYIINNFVPEFISNIIINKYIDRTIITNNKNFTKKMTY